MKKSRTAGPSRVVESPTVRSLPVVDVLEDTKAALFALMVQSGLQVLDALLEEDRTALCGPRYAHQADRHASRAGRSPCSGPACGPRAPRSPAADLPGGGPGRSPESPRR